MTKSTRISDAYVRVELRSPGDFGFASMSGITRTDEETRRELSLLADEARRGIRSDQCEKGHISEVIETEDYCSHCDYPWEDAEPCCQAREDEEAAQ